MEPNFQDFLGWALEKDVLNVIKDEILYFSGKVYKYNSFSIKQERNLVLTDKCLYNFHNKKVKRQMKYEEMLGITFSNVTNEFVVHANKGYDFHFLSQERTIIIYIIAKCYQKLLNKPIILCEVKEKSLKQYVTTKKDKKKDSTNSRLDENNTIDTQTFIIDNDPEEIHKRSKTEVSGGKICNNVSPLQENPKYIESEVIFSNDSKLKSVGFEDFDIYKIIGRGTTGKVFFAKNKYNNEYYALKSVDKKIFDINDSCLKKIKKLSKNMSSPFLINVHFCFETEERIYFAFPYIQGEELSYTIKTNKNFDEEKVKFYSAIIALSLDYLHNNGIDYRFFNSKNIIIDKDGYLKIVPFHIGKVFNVNNNYKNAKKILEKYKNEYTPPEIFLDDNTQNIKAADWWNLGVIIFEMIYTIPPFIADDKDMKNMVTTTELKFPINPKISDNLKDLITKLLNKNYEERLGFQNGLADIKNHEFFKDFNFEELLEKKIEPPYKPTIGDILENNKKIEEKFTYEDLKKNGIFISY
jgi:serum/glucocorticoid-regulated kinase 2